VAPVRIERFARDRKHYLMPSQKKNRGMARQKVRPADFLRRHQFSDRSINEEQIQGETAHELFREEDGC
jgi:hypothetical protein